MTKHVLLAFMSLSLITYSCRQTSQNSNSSEATDSLQNVNSNGAVGTKMVGTAKAFVKKDSLRTFLNAAKVLAENTRKEEGNLYYHYYQDPEDSTQLLFVEEFRTEAALGIHSGSLYFQAFVRTVTPMLSKPLDVAFYKVTIL